MSGTALLKWLPFIDAGPGEASRSIWSWRYRACQCSGSVAPGVAEAQAVAESAA